jgi:di/tricarboxylate transporter
MAIARLLVIALVTCGAMFSPFTPTRGRRTHVAARPTVAMALPLAAAPRAAAAQEGQDEDIPGAIVIVIVLGAVIGVAELAVSRFKRRE